MFQFEPGLRYPNVCVLSRLLLHLPALPVLRMAGISIPTKGSVEVSIAFSTRPNDRTNSVGLEK